MRVMGLMSGTSVDGIDVACVTIAGQDLAVEVMLEAGITVPYGPDLRSQILAVCGGEALTVAQLTALDDAIAQSFAAAALDMMATTGPVDLIGSHGQTVFHRPPHGNALGYSVQLGRGELIAHLTQTPTVSNFRAADIAAGGQGAPLVSRLDVALLGHPTEHRCIQNLGGIGNVTYLPPQQCPDWQGRILGWDTGPGNVLMDLAIAHLTQNQHTYDPGGQWAAQGQPCAPLIVHWLQHPFFQQPPPKSTGRELFSPDYLQQCRQSAQAYALSDADWLATLTDFTAQTIAHSYRHFLPHPPDRVLLCGGGSRNDYLRARIAHHLAPAGVETTDQHGVDAGSKEAIAFALLAYWRWHHWVGNVPAVTGAKQGQPLGEIHPVIRRS